MKTNVTITDFYRRPKDVLEHVDEGPVLISRRGKEDLVVAKASDVQRSSKGLALAAQLLASPIGRIRTVDRDAVHAAEEVFPWINFFSPEERESFLTELLATLRASASVESFDRLLIVVAAWFESAVAVADGVPEGTSHLDFFDAPRPVERP